MVTLKFGDATADRGFTQYATSGFNEASPVKIVRELIQNSLDGAVEAGESRAIVRFRVSKIGASDVPDIDGYKQVFKSAIEYSHPLSDAATDVVHRVERALGMLKSKQARLLSVIDNGVGLDSKRMRSLLGDGAGMKSSNLAGSYGVGHLAPMATSDLRYLLYGGVTEDGNRIVSGKAVLASHTGNGGRRRDADGYLINGFNRRGGEELYRFMAEQDHPPVVSRCLDEIQREWGHGCAVLIPGFNNFKQFMDNPRSLKDVVFKVAAYNFGPAIHRDNLVLEVCGEDDDRQYGKMDKDSIAAFLDGEKGGVRVARSDSFFAGLRPSGRQAAGVLTALTGNVSRTVSLDAGCVTVSLHQERDVNYSSIDLFRNGMRITDEAPSLTRADFANRRPFHAVVEIDAEDGGVLHPLIRKAEGPMHDRLEFKLLADSERKKVTKALTEIGDWIRNRVPAIGADAYMIDDVLLVDTGDSARADGGNFAFWGTPTPISRRRGPITPISNSNDSDESAQDGTISGGGSGASGRQRPTRPLPFRSVMAPEGHDVLVGSIMSIEDCVGVKAIVRVDENADSTCDRVWGDEDVLLKNFWIASGADSDEPTACAISSDGRWAEIPELKAQENYSIRIEHAPLPENLDDAVQYPVLRIDLYKPGKSSGYRPE